MDKLLTLDEAGAILGVTGERVSQLVKQGRIPAERFGTNKRYLRLRESDVRRYQASRLIPKALPSRPAKKSTPAEPIAV